MKIKVFDEAMKVTRIMKKLNERGRINELVREANAIYGRTVLLMAHLQRAEMWRYRIKRSLYQ